MHHEFILMPEIDEIAKYGIVMHRMRRDEIQTVREWRNDPSVSRTMRTQQHISYEDQERWFERIIKRDDAFYFTARYGGDLFAYLCIQNIDWVQRYGDTGTIIDPNLTAAILAWNAVLCCNDFIFDIIGMDHIRTSMMIDNHRAQRFNRLLGLREIDGAKNANEKDYILDRDTYFKQRDILKKRLHFE